MNSIEPLPMRKRIMVFAAVILMGIGVLAEESETAYLESLAKEIKMIKESGALNENHKHLEYFIGDWESQVKYWFQPNTEPVTDKQDIQVIPLIEGRFTLARLKGNLLGTPYEIDVIMGYDSVKKEFFSISLSDLGTGYTINPGTLDKTGKTRTDTGEGQDSATGEKVKLRAVTTIIDKDKYTYEQYQTYPGKEEFKSMEVVYLRKK